MLSPIIDTTEQLIKRLPSNYVRTIGITILQNGTPYTVPSGVHAVITFTGTGAVFVLDGVNSIGINLPVPITIQSGQVISNTSATPLSFIAEEYTNE